MPDGSNTVRVKGFARVLLFLFVFLVFCLFGWLVGWFFFFLRQGFSVALEPILKLALVDQAGLEFTEILLPLPPRCWD